MQKPLCLLSRIVLASTKPGTWILDPFAGSSTTGIAANLLQRRYLGIEQEDNFLEMSFNRRKEIEQSDKGREYHGKLNTQAQIFHDKDVSALEEPEVRYDPELPF